MSYRESRSDSFRQHGILVGRVLKSERALPICRFERPTRFEYVIKLRTASALGLVVPVHCLCSPMRGRLNSRTVTTKL